MKGEFQRFSKGKLLTFLKQLDTEISLHLCPRHGDNLKSETIISLYKLLGHDFIIPKPTSNSDLPLPKLLVSAYLNSL